MGSVIAFIAALVLGLTFMASSVSKLRDPGAFVLGVLEYRVLPPRLAIVYGRVLPSAELACGLALLIGLWPPVVGGLTAALLVSFLLAVTINLVRGRRVDCHCFGSRQNEPLGWTTIARLCVLLLCATIVIGWRGRSALALAPPDPIPAGLVAGGVVVMLYLLSAIPALWRLLRTQTDESVRVRGRRVSLATMPIERRLPPSVPIPNENVRQEV